MCINKIIMSLFNRYPPLRIKHIQMTPRKLQALKTYIGVQWCLNQLQHPPLESKKQV